ncbi:LysR family transcriptional regulator [Neorhizobium sp. DT-125]|uniref:LysR family transcriptional regulator n=1 Tax=Neorhizobium sp. DT-125 TaxID=3396163 RepID=UPI003F195281
MRNNVLMQLELNLLFAFDAIYREGNVTRAAERLGIGQPALSYSLSRLRTIFEDDLFVRVPRGVQPTPRAISLIAPIQEALEAVRRLAEPNIRFDPLRDELTFRIVISDDLEMSMMPILLADLAAMSPRLRLETVSANSGQDLELIDLAQVDLAVGIFSDGGFHHKRKVICDMEPYSVLFDPVGTGLSGHMSLDDYVRFPHVSIDSRTVLNARIEKELERLRRRRVIALTTPHALVVPYMLRETPLLATVPRRAAMTLAPHFGLGISELPLDLPSESILMVWHESHSTDPANLWLRRRIEAVAQEIVRRDGLAGETSTPFGVAAE